MAASLDYLTKTILDAPLGHVEQTIDEILQKPVRLDVIEQNLVSGTRYERRIMISAGQIPILVATAKFDSKNIPDSIMKELLQKKDGIGKILLKHNISAYRNILEMRVETGLKKLTRKYEIWHNDSIWFEITEEIQLDLNTS